MKSIYGNRRYQNLTNKELADKLERYQKRIRSTADIAYSGFCQGRIDEIRLEQKHRVKEGVS